MPVKELRLLAFLAVAVTVTTSALAQEPARGMLGATDLRSIVLSPAPLGPPAQFEPQPPAVSRIEAATGQTLATTEPAAPPRLASSKFRPKAAAVVRRPKPSALNSYARDVQRQTWPCTGGGICAWTQPR